MPTLICNNKESTTEATSRHEATSSTRLLQDASETMVEVRTYSSISTSQPQERDAERGLTTTSETTKYEKVTVWYWTSKSYLWSLAALITLLLVFTALEYLLLKYNLPPLSPEERREIRFPTNLEDLRKMNSILSLYMDKNYFNVYSTFIITYIYLQSFSIPGSMWLSILGGTLFNFWLTLFTVSMCSAIGASIAYLISASLGSVAVIHIIGDRLSKWKEEQLVHHKQHMLNYMIVLRISPFPPNWTVNLGSPHLDVPLKAFFWGTVLGVAPPSFIHVQAGAALERLSASDKLRLLTPINVLCLLAVAIAALVPVFIKRRFDRQQQQEQEHSQNNITTTTIAPSSTAASISSII